MKRKLDAAEIPMTALMRERCLWRPIQYAPAGIPLIVDGWEIEAERREGREVVRANRSVVVATKAESGDWTITHGANSGGEFKPSYYQYMPRTFIDLTDRLADAAQAFDAIKAEAALTQHAQAAAQNALVAEWTKQGLSPWASRKLAVGNVATKDDLAKLAQGGPRDLLRLSGVGRLSIDRLYNEIGVFLALEAARR